jgi:Uma2 family endonuclease
MSTAVETRYTPEDLLALPEPVQYELVDGQLVERNMGALSSLIGLTLGHFMRAHCEPKHGWVFGADCGYQCFPDDPNKVRKPDVSFVRRERLPGGPPKGHIRLAPDLAAEVLSPNDLATEVETKVQEYLGAGVKLVWVVNPDLRTVRVHRADGSITGLSEHDELDGEDVLSGFRCRVGELFTPAETENEAGSA